MHVFTGYLVLTAFLSCQIAASSSNDVANLTLGFYIPIRSKDFDARPILPAMDVMLQLINNRSDILPGYRLNTMVANSGCSASVTVRNFVNQIFEPPIKVAMIAPPCSTASEAMAQLAHFWNLVLISPGASSPRLSNVNTYPTFLRAVSTDSQVAEGVATLMKTFQWNHLALVTQQEFLFTTTSEELLATFNQQNFSNLDLQEYLFLMNPSDQVKRIHNTHYRIIFINAYPINALEILCQAYDLGMTRENGYLWIMYSWYGDNWWTREDCRNCSLTKRVAMVEGGITIDHFPSVRQEEYDDITDIGVSRHEFDRLYDERVNQSYSNLTDFSARAFTAHYADTMWTMALALNATEASLSSVTNGTVQSLKDFTYDSDDIREALYQNSLAVKFKGLTGSVVYRPNGDRQGFVRFFQYRRISDTENLVSNMFGEINGTSLKYADGESPNTIFFDGIVPIDEKTNHIDLSLFISFSLLAIVGVVLSASSLLFNVIFRKRKVVKLSSPLLNILTNVGCMMFYIAVIIFGLDEGLVCHGVANALCVTKLWITVIAFSLVFGTIFAKTWRVYYIFKNSHRSKLNNKYVVHDAFLLAMVGVLVTIDVVFLTVVTAIPSSRLQIENIQLPFSGSNLPVVINICTAKDRFIWLGVLFGYKGLFLLIGLFLAFETRKVKISHLNDSRLIGMSVYGIFIISIALAPISVVLETHVDLHYAISSVMILFGVTSFLALITAPKVYSLIKDPKGSNVMKSMTYANGDANSVDFLKREVTKLKAQLAESQKTKDEGSSSNRTSSVSLPLTPTFHGIHKKTSISSLQSPFPLPLNVNGVIQEMSTNDNTSENGEPMNGNSNGLKKESTNGISTSTQMNIEIPIIQCSNELKNKVANENNTTSMKENN